MILGIIATSIAAFIATDSYYVSEAARSALEHTQRELEQTLDNAKDSEQEATLAKAEAVTFSEELSRETLSNRCLRSFRST